jgi:hypothetical protein
MAMIWSVSSVEGSNKRKEGIALAIQTVFGDELAKKYGLNDLPCKTFLFLIGIEAAKLAYVRVSPSSPIFLIIA